LIAQFQVLKGKRRTIIYRVYEFLAEAGEKAATGISI